MPSPPESPDQSHGSVPGGGRLGGGAACACCCGGGGGGGGAFAICGGGGGFGGSIGLHSATLCLMPSWSTASSALSFFSSACASSSEAFNTGVGSGGGGGAGGAGVSWVATLSDGSTGAQARSAHEASSSRIRKSRPHSSAPHQRDHQKVA